MKTVIMASGFGSRLWPLSTSVKPKQFQPLIRGQSLLQYVYSQADPKSHDVFIEVLKGSEDWVHEQLPDFPESNILPVPERRDTLPHTLLNLKKLSTNEDEGILFVGSDLYAPQENGLLAMLNTMRTSTRELSQINMLGLTPHRPDTTLGYAISDENDKIIKFLEKPQRSEVESLLAGGRASAFYCSYVTSIRAMKLAIDALEDQDLAQKCRRLLDADNGHLPEYFLDMPFVNLAGIWRTCANSKIVHVDGELIDIGKFTALRDLNPRDEAGNVVIGDVLIEEGASNNIVVNKLSAPLVVSAVHDMVIIQTTEGSVVCPVDGSDTIGEVYKSKIIPRHREELR